jgi:hypothetical protein
MSYRQSMSPTPPRVDELDPVVAFVADEARKYFDTVGERPVRDAQAEEAAASFDGSLPEDGIGAIAALRELIGGGGGLVHSAGPKFFHPRGIRTPEPGWPRRWVGISNRSPSAG